MGRRQRHREKGPGEPANNWSWWEAEFRVEPSGIGLDFWNSYAQHLDRAVAAGCDAFRLSVEWARCVDRAGFGVDGQAEPARDGDRRGQSPEIPCRSGAGLPVRARDDQPLAPGERREAILGTVR